MKVTVLQLAVELKQPPTFILQLCTHLGIEGSSDSDLLTPDECRKILFAVKTGVQPQNSSSQTYSSSEDKEKYLNKLLANPSLRAMDRSNQGWITLLDSQINQLPFSPSPRLRQAFEYVDRAWFVSAKADGCGECKTKREFMEKWDIIRRKSSPSCYSSNPVYLGYNVNNSATFMHLIGALFVQEQLEKEHVRVLDVGCGTGFTTSVFALAAKDPEVIVGIDHIEEFIVGANRLTEWTMPELRHRLTFVYQDARLGLAEYAPYDIIHLGAAAPSDVSLALLLSNLRVGGQLIGPVGEYGSQEFVLFTRTASGFDRVSLFGVRYTMLQDKEEQLLGY